MAENFKLPGSSYEELIKIVKAYATGKVGAPMSLEVVAQTAKMDKTIVSRNNGFLVQLTLISEGNKKAPTQLGSDLGRAYSLNMNEEIIQIWQNAIETNEFLTRMLSAIKIRNGMERTEFVNHILYSSGSSTNNNTRTGASTIIEIYKVAQLITEDDGKIIATERDTLVKNEDSRGPQSTMGETNSTDVISVPVPLPSVTTTHSSISLNINLDVSLEDFDLLNEKIKLLIKSLNEID